MAKIQKALATLAQKLHANGLALSSARSTWQRYHDAAHRAHEKAKKAQNEADQLRSAGKPKKAQAKDARAQNLLRKATVAHLKAQQVIAQVKDLTETHDGLAKSESELIARKKKLQGKVEVKGDKATGGTQDERLQTVMLTSAARCRSGKRRNFYSQSGSWDVDHCLTGPSFGHRDDCSSWFTSVYKSAQLADPNRNDFRGGYTGTLGAHGLSISRSQASHTPGAAVLFGSAPFHHVEMAIGDGTEHTIGHGSAPVDMGTFSLLPGPVSFRSY